MKKGESTEAIVVDSASDCTVIHFDTESTSLSVYREHVVQLAAEVWRWNGSRSSCKRSQELDDMLTSVLYPLKQQQTLRQHITEFIGPLLPSLENTHETFNEYVYTARPMHFKAAEATGISTAKVLTASDCFGKVAARFFKWVSEQRRRPDEPVLLVAHNGSGFDVPIMMQEMQRHGMPRSTWAEAGITHLFDTLTFFNATKYAEDPISRAPFPTTKKGDPCYKLGGVYKTMFKSSFKEHDALADAQAMARVVAGIETWASSGSWLRHAQTMRYRFSEFDRLRKDRLPASVDKASERPPLSPAEAQVASASASASASSPPPCAASSEVVVASSFVVPALPPLAAAARPFFAAAPTTSSEVVASSFVVPATLPPPPPNAARRRVKRKLPLPADEAAKLVAVIPDTAASTSFYRCQTCHIVVSKHFNHAAVCSTILLHSVSCNSQKALSPTPMGAASETANDDEQPPTVTDFLGQFKRQRPPLK